MEERGEGEGVKESKRERKQKREGEREHERATDKNVIEVVSKLEFVFTNLRWSDLPLSPET